VIRMRRLPPFARICKTYRHSASTIGIDRQSGGTVCDIAWRAQLRLTTRFRRLVARGKAKPKVATAIGRELSGCVLGDCAGGVARAAVAHHDG
jgi:hypothetical protein